MKRISSIARAPTLANRVHQMYISSFLRKVFVSIHRQVAGTVGIESALVFLCFVAFHYTVLSVRAVRRDIREPAVEDDHRLR